ncbi:hypothetical protein [Burkholderia sp. AU16741]|uniref:hypothetical protein n=1 Tax=Burkholderia sp. AU16741 TaxID=2015347 RepID=UPI0015C59095|nr:hypothetical protein [Burkholderia sp. AU16741]
MGAVPFDFRWLHGQQIRPRRAARVGRPVEAGLSATARLPTIDDMLREPKEKLMRYATCGMGVGAAPLGAACPFFRKTRRFLQHRTRWPNGAVSKIDEKEISLVRSTRAAGGAIDSSARIEVDSRKPKIKSDLRETMNRHFPIARFRVVGSRVVA